MNYGTRFEEHARLGVVLVDPGDFTPSYDLALAEGLVDAGHEVRLVGKHGFDQGPCPPFRCEHFYRGLAGTLGFRLPGALARVAKGAHHIVDMARLGRRLAHWAPDVLHWQWSPLPLLDRQFLSRLRRLAPVVVTLHDSNPYNGATGWLMRSGYMALLRNVDAVIVHTAQAEERLAAAGVPRHRVHRLPIGLLHTPLHPVARPPQNADDRRLRLLQFGKIRPYKGVDVLLEALAQLSADERARLDVKIIGQPYVDTAPLQAFVREHGLEDTVEFRFGYVDDTEMDRLFATADAALFPYREIDASAVAMTAVAHGVPALASAVGGFSEQFRDGYDARMVPPGDPRAVAAVLREWASAPDALFKLADGMVAHRAQVPSWNEIGQRTVSVYHQARKSWILDFCNRPPRTCR
jgi:glycosyltransferase involved in cell wall biosynthesis